MAKKKTDDDELFAAGILQHLAAYRHACSLVARGKAADADADRLSAAGLANRKRGEQLRARSIASAALGKPADALKSEGDSLYGGGTTARREAATAKTAAQTAVVDGQRAKERAERGLQNAIRQTLDQIEKAFG